MNTEIKFSEECKHDLLYGVASYIKPKKKKGRAVVHINGICVSKDEICFLANLKKIALLSIPNSIDFNRGDTVTFEFKEDAINIRMTID